MPLSFIDYGKSAFGGFAEYYPGDGTRGLRRGRATRRSRPSCATPSRDAARAMRGLADWLEGQRRTATQDFALGAERFAQMLRDTEMVDVPLAELEAIGRADLQRNQQALQRGLRAATRRARRVPACMDADERAASPRAARSPARGAQLAGLRAFIVAARPRHHPGHRGGAGRGIAALQPAEFRLYRHSRAL